MPRTKKSNNLITYHDVEQGSEEWHQLRKDCLSGSNAAKMLTSFGAGSHSTAHSSTFTGNFHTERGHLLETQAIKLYERIKGITVSHTGLVTNSSYPNCVYSPDGYRDDRTIEVKSFSIKKHLETIKRPTLEILAQCHFGQLILEKKLTDLILYCPKEEVPVEQRLVIITIKYDKDIQDNFKRKIKEYNDKRKV